MELVCKESRRPFTWFYHGDSDMFIRLNKQGRINGEISGINLPDPMSILEHRIRLKKEGRLNKDARVYADPVTQKLWDYHHANLNNEL